MKNLILSISSILLVVSCHNTATDTSEYVADSTRQLSDLTESYIVAYDQNTTGITEYNHMFHQDASGYLLPKGGRAAELDGKVYKKGQLQTEIYVDMAITDASVANATVVSMVNTVLDELYFGMEVIVDTDAQSPNGTFQRDLSLINTDDTVNVENIVDRLQAAAVFDKDKQLHIYLFDRTSFFKTANAIAFESENHKFIFGSAYLFKNPMLFVHELGHVLGLNHTSAKESLDLCYNVMHESSIGCANHVHPRQSLVVASGHLTQPFDNNSIVFPVGTTCDCQSESIYKTKFQRYMNSIDRGIGDEELVGNVNMLSEALVDIDNLPPEFEANFRKQALVFFDNSNTALIDTFVQWSKEAQLALRKNNLLRLAAATVDKLHPGRNNTLWQVMEQGTMTVPQLLSALDTVKSKYDPSTLYISLDPAVRDSIAKLKTTVIKLESTIRDLKEQNRLREETLKNSLIIDLNCRSLYKEGTVRNSSNYTEVVQSLLKECGTGDRVEPNG